MNTKNTKFDRCMVTTAYYSGRKAARVKFSVTLANSFFYCFGGRDGPRDKTSGHELSSRSRSLYSGREAPS